MVLMFTDMVGSTDLKSRIGIAAYAPLAARAEQLFHRTVATIPGADILKDTGDGYMASFETASSAVLAALRFQHALAIEPWANESIRMRIGLHEGEVTVAGPDIAGKPKIIGLAIDIAARVTSLALPGQILLTRATFDDARQFIREYPEHMPVPVDADPRRPVLRWLAYGPYLFKGAEQPLEIFEVGAEGIAPLSPPPDAEKARRSVTHDQEETLGWRPAIGLPVPHRENWILNRKLGEGGFGEVWLAIHDKARTRRVFKFCFDADRLRSLKRELTLLRLLHDALGSRSDIARLEDVQLDAPPYFLVSEFADLGNLIDWIASEGGIDSIAMQRRLEIVARLADAAAAAHSVGVLHKDIKPNNVLMFRADAGAALPRLADFGIGALTDRAQLASRNITVGGATLSELTMAKSSASGTPLYAPPETLAGMPFAVQGDIYALGVLLYQFVIGDLRRPLAVGWERDVDDHLLRADIAVCVDGDPARRLRSASELAQRLRSLDARRAADCAARISIVREARRRRATRAILASAAGLAVLLAIAVIGFVRERTLRDAAETARAAERQQRELAEAARLAESRQREEAEAVSSFLQDMLSAPDPAQFGRDVTVRQVIDSALKKLDAGELARQPRIESAIRGAIGSALHGLGLYEAARPQLQKALDIRRAALPADDPETIASVNNLGLLLHDTGRLPEAEKLLREALDARRRQQKPQPLEIAQSLNNLAMLLHDAGNDSEAEQLFKDALAIYTKENADRSTDRAACLNNFAILYQSRGDLAAAEPLLREALNIRRDRLGDQHPHVATTLNNLAMLVQARENFSEADNLFQQSLDVMKRVLGPEHPEVAICLSNIALLRQKSGELPRSVEPLAQALAIRRKTLGNENDDTLQNLVALAAALYYTDRAADAEPLFRELLAVREKRSPDPLELAETRSSLAACLLELNRPNEAEPLARAALEFRSGNLAPDDWRIASTENILGAVLAQLGESDAAEKLLIRSAQSLQKAEKLPPIVRRRAIERLAHFYDQTGRPDESAKWRTQVSGSRP